MLSVIFKIVLTNIEQPFEFMLQDESTFTFDYGFGREQWGVKDLRFKIKFYSINKTNIKIMKDYAENLYPYLQEYENIEEIGFYFFDDKDSSKNQSFVYKKHEFNNLNLTQSIEPPFGKSFNIAFNINQKKGENIWWK